MTCWTGSPGGAAASRAGGSAAASGSGSWPLCGCCMSGRKRKNTSGAARCWCTRCGCGTAARCWRPTRHRRAFLACSYDPAKALCHPGRPAGKNAGHPDLDRCNPACANIARTDEHVAALTAEIARLRAEAASPLAPEPIRQRLTQRADALEQIADRHARTRVTTRSDDARG